MSECIQKRTVGYDKTGDNHYDTISAFIKSMRGSDPDAAVYYLAKMLYAGEDVRFIARRIMICASEDVGNADPMALTVAVSAAQAVERIGLPESTDHPGPGGGLCGNCAPKSNAAVNAIFEANGGGEARRAPAVPRSSAGRPLSGCGRSWDGAPATNMPMIIRTTMCKQQYMPSELEGRVFYRPSDNGYEKTIAAHMKKLKEEAE